MKRHICQPDEKIADVDRVEAKIDGSVETLSFRGRVYKCNKCGRKFLIPEDCISPEISVSLTGEKVSYG